MTASSLFLLMDQILKPVTQVEFFAHIRENALNVHPRIVSSWPYRSEWRMQDGSRRLIGVSQERPIRTEYPNGLTETIYYLAL